MGVTRALLHSYSLLVRDRGRAASAKQKHHVPRGMFSSNPRCCLPKRSPMGPVLVPSGQVEQRGERVLARAFSLGKAASVVLSAGSLAADISDDAASPMAGALARLALQGLSSGLVNGLDMADPFIMDLGAGLVGQVATHGASRVQKYASDELKESGGALGGRDQLVRLAAYCAFVDTPITHWWQDWLDQVVMPHDPTGPLAVALKVILDQGLMAPLATILMLTTLKILEGKGHEALPYAKKKFLDKLLPDYAVWPVARVVEFAFIPQAQQPIFEGIVSVASAAVQLLQHNCQKQQQDQGVPQPEQQGVAAAATDSPQRSLSTQAPRTSVLHPDVSHRHEQHHHYHQQAAAMAAATHASHDATHLFTINTAPSASQSNHAGATSTQSVWHGPRAISPFAKHAHVPLESPRSVGSPRSLVDSVRSKVTASTSSDASLHGQMQLALST